MLVKRENIERIAGLLETLGTPQFGPQFYVLFNDLLAAKQCVAFAFSRTGARCSLVAEGRDEQNRRTASSLADEYVRWAFERDQNAQRALVAVSKERPGISVYTCAATDLKDAGYRRRFYDEPELRGKLVMLANMGQTFYYVNFYRGQMDPTFTPREVDTARSLAALGVQALARHREMSSVDRSSKDLPVPQADMQRGPIADQIRDLFFDIRSGLTHRESEICAGIVVGHTTEELGLSLGISVHTVATHRKRAYAKLGVTSQGGLFAQYLRYSGKSSIHAAAS